MTEQEAIDEAIHIKERLRNAGTLDDLARVCDDVRPKVLEINEASKALGTQIVSLRDTMSASLAANEFGRGAG